MANDKKKAPVEDDVLFRLKPDRRLLSYAPDVTGHRTNRDRRGRDSADTGTSSGYIKLQQDDKNGQRYLVDYSVTVRFTLHGQKKSVQMKGEDISTTGILLTTPSSAEQVPLMEAEDVRLTFEITPGSMPEGYEMMVRKIPATCVREASRPDGAHLYGMQFKSTLAEFSNTHRKNYMLAVASFFLAVIVFVIVLMRAESVIYFQFNRWLYLYSIIAATFLLTRYLFGSFYRPTKIDPDYTPGVTIIVPCFNEEKWIQHTILGCINQDYPIDKLEVIVIDDCSNDHSVDKIKEIIERLKQSDGDQKMYRVEDRLHYYVQPVNKGKREAMAVGAHMAKHELLVFVDSDSFLDPYAVRNIVQPFKDKKMGGVSGRTDVANTYTNSLTKMQAVRYYIAFRIMKAAEGYFDAVTCLSGPLSEIAQDVPAPTDALEALLAPGIHHRGALYVEEGALHGAELLHGLACTDCSTNHRALQSHLYPHHASRLPAYVPRRHADDGTAHEHGTALPAAQHDLDFRRVVLPLLRGRPALADASGLVHLLEIDLGDAFDASGSCRD